MTMEDYEAHKEDYKDNNVSSSAFVLIQDVYIRILEEQLKAKNERIRELEEAMKSKTCDWCKQSWEPNNQTFHKYFCEYLKIPVHGGFYCNRYEPKG